MCIRDRAKQINEDRAAKEEEVFDGEEVTKETTAEETETTEELSLIHI